MLIAGPFFMSDFNASYCCALPVDQAAMDFCIWAAQAVLWR